MRRSFELFEEPAETGLNRWMVSYADFITVLFVMFLAIYVLMPELQAEQENTNAATTAANAGQPTPSRTANEATAELDDLAAVLSAVLKPYLQSGEVTVTTRPDGVALEIRDAALFRPGTTEISSLAATNLLNFIGSTLAQNSNAIRVEGHTDNLAINNGVFPSNWELSSARAGRVVRILEENAVLAERLSAVGLGATQPVATNLTEEGRALNRRVTVLVLTGRPENKAGE